MEDIRYITGCIIIVDSSTFLMLFINPYKGTV